MKNPVFAFFAASTAAFASVFAYGGAPRCIAIPPRPSGVVIPDHSAQRIAAADAKRLRKAARRSGFSCLFCTTLRREKQIGKSRRQEARILDRQRSFFCFAPHPSSARGFSGDLISFS